MFEELNNIAPDSPMRLRFIKMVVVISPFLAAIIMMILYFPDNMFAGQLSDAEKMKQFLILLDTVSAFVGAPFVTNQVLSKILTGKYPPPESGILPAETRMNLHAFIGVFQIVGNCGLADAKFHFWGILIGFTLILSAVRIWLQKKKNKDACSPS